MKTILLFLLLCISLSTSAQTADERAGTYMYTPPPSAEKHL